MKEKFTAGQIVNILRDWHHEKFWLFIKELRIGTGYGKEAEQRVDAWAMTIMPHKGFKRIAYEVKVSRNDFLHEIEHWRKRRRALLLSNEFYFVTPPDLIRPGELPLECGWKVIRRKIPGEVFQVGWRKRRWYNFVRDYVILDKVDAPWRDTGPPPWRFVASLLRRVRDDEKIDLDLFREKMKQAEKLPEEYF